MLPLSALSVRVDTANVVGQQWVNAVARDFSAQRGGGKRLNVAANSLNIDGIVEGGGDPNWVSTSALTSLEPVQTFSGTSSRIMSAMLYLRADEPGMSSSSVRRDALWLDALAHPFTGTDGRRYSPPPIIVTWDTVSRMRCVMQSVQTRWHGGIDESGLFMCADVSIEVVSAAAGFQNYNGINRNQNPEGAYRG